MVVCDRFADFPPGGLSGRARPGRPAPDQGTLNGFIGDLLPDLTLSSTCPSCGARASVAAPPATPAPDRFEAEKHGVSRKSSARRSARSGRRRRRRRLRHYRRQRAARAGRQGHLDTVAGQARSGNRAAPRWKSRRRKPGLVKLSIMRPQGKTTIPSTASGGADRRVVRHANAEAALLAATQGRIRMPS